MSVPYDLFTGAFLSKITEFSFIRFDEDEWYDYSTVVDQFMKVACSQFNKVCKYDLVTGDNKARELAADIPADELDEIVDIVSTGMVAQWLQPYMYRSENLENILNTADYSMYSPAELLYRVREVYQMAQRDFKRMVKEYSYNHGDLTNLAL